MLAATHATQAFAEAKGRCGSAARRYHLCLSPAEIARTPELLDTVREAGVTDIWLAAFLYGYWYCEPRDLKTTARVVEEHGLSPHVINVPLGHPGDSLGARDGETPLSPPSHWRLARRANGSTYSGTSLHAPAMAENAKALRAIARAGFREVFLDDDYRLAPSPGEIGGCFCDDCRDAFLKLHGWGASEWESLLGAVSERRLTPELEAWIEHWCDQLTGAFRAMQAAAPAIDLGNMVMIMGAEKAGIRLADYSDALFRVGEGQFSDGPFGSVKGKTDELFSALFHRRFAAPERAFSESTAYPCDQLSAPNMAAKLSVSLLSDVRNTMFMSGLTPFPATHWETLGPAMAESARLHDRVAGHAPRGPFKHFWGKHGRYVSEDRPFSLFLALGVPFEVTNERAGDGWTFLGDADARAFASQCSPRGSALVIRRGAAAPHPGWTTVDEDLSALFAFRRSVLPRLRGVPHIAEETPVVLAWHPTARRAIAWNLTEEARRVTLVRDGVELTKLWLSPLGVALAERLPK